ncbi:MAG TPA: ADOP family duplicated permease [Longimicrobiales bacterium]|nr:ADOP family duplicated permease [Longimicrobiales bacterium]
MDALILTCYRVLSLGLPGDLRRACLPDMLADLDAVLRHERERRGEWGVALAGVRALGDLKVAVLRERWVAARGYQWERAARLRGRMGMGERMMMGFRELRLALRALLQRPGFAGIATVTLGLGIGATVAIFTVVNAVVLQPLPFEGSDRIVEIRHSAPAIDLPDLTNSPGTLTFYGEHASVFSAITGQLGARANVTLGEGTVQEQVAIVSPEWFDVFQLQPAIGRAFTEADVPDDRPPGGVILTQSGVDRFFAGNRNVIGETLTVDGNVVDVVGVMPEDFVWPGAADTRFLAPLFVDPEGGFGTFGTNGFARLAEGQTLESAQAQLEALQLRVSEYDPEVTPEVLESFGWGVRVRTLKESIVGDVGSTLFIVLGTVGLVLLIACANVANLFLVRAETRQKELGIRAALGAGRNRIAGTFLSESLVLGGMGGILGMAIASLGVDAILHWAPEELPRLNEIAITPTVLAFAGAVSVLSGLLLGAIPMIRYAGRGFSAMLRDGNRTSTDGRGRHRARNVLVMSQLAIALVLLVGSGLLFRSFSALQRIDLGFDPADKLVVGLSVGQNMPNDEAAATYQEVIDRVEGLPGVVSAGFTLAAPLSTGNATGGSVEVEGEERPDNAPPRVVLRQSATAGYLAAMGYRLVEGREMAPYEWQSEVPVVWVNEYARDMLLDGEALGKRITWGGQGDDVRYAEIVGVYENWKAHDVTEDPAGWSFSPMLLEGMPEPPLQSGQVVVRTASGIDPTSILPSVRQIVSEVNSTVPVTRVQTMEEVVAASMADRSITLVLLGIATLVAVFLGTIGLFGVISYVVGQRRREIGVRMALGAESGAVSSMVIRQSAGVVGGGVVVGLIGALGLSRVLDSLLYSEVSATDPVTFVTAPVLLLAVSLFATWLPARKASQIDPIEALRME